MNEYRITINRTDIPSNNIQVYSKWAKDERQAMSYIFKNKPKDGYCVMKKGGFAKLISIERTK